jgi:pimeloyl-ACP methyl ester carboxylesterase
MRHPIATLVILALVLPLVAQGEDLRLAMHDGYELDARLDLPDGPVSAVVVLVHGSGANGLDHDLSSISQDGEENLFFRDVAGALVAEGLAVLRFHKRTHQFRVDGLTEDGDRVQAYAAAPLQTLLADVAAMAGHAQTRYPEARLLLLGVSQGTYLALQTAQATELVDGLVLIGFHLASLDMLVHEQTVYRSLASYRGLDGDGDGYLDRDELAAGGQLGAQLGFQLPQLDADGDGRYSRQEFMAANLSNLVVRDVIGTAYRAHEASLPRPAEILGALAIPVLFCQGEWDNQTPAYQARAVEIANRLVWKHDNLQFRFYPERGHILDPRDGYDDLVYRPIDPEILAEVARATAELVR